MTHMRKTLHIVLGLELVLKGRHHEFLCGSEGPILDGTGYVIPEAEYRSFIQPYVSGKFAASDAATYSLEPIAETNIVLSRPKLLSRKGAMNCRSEGGYPLYKVKRIQEIIQDCQIVFHMFIEDHVSYLSKVAQSENPIYSGVEYSWLPLIDGVSGKLFGDSKLRIWNVGNIDHSFGEFLCSTLGVEVAVDFSSRISGSLTRKFEAEHSDQLVREFGLSPDELDDQYLDDLEVIRQRSRKGSNHARFAEG